ncbi:DUF2817 domain-containing protein [Hellea balneolensis]|uniref:DUF2817 domain-containing protein n=1 Tax=Hellea balneolensis TaxID=287478 RepID=UPI00040F3240|nr:DUF2817 domain-containing protein [Hellea balneolensis]
MNFGAIAEEYAFENYDEARTSFLKKVNATGGILRTYLHPDSPQLDGTEFAIDTAWYGPKDADAVLIMVSGTHGLELFSGSAMQRLWVDNFQSALPSNIGVLLVHSVNAYGSAYYSRTTENNVDLNRNFIDFSDQPKATALTEKVQNALCVSKPKGPRNMIVAANLLCLAIRHGKSKVVNEITGGQYERRDGIGFGGFAPEWSNRMLNQIVTENLTNAKKVAIIDWHTGIGSYGEPFFLCFDSPNSPEFRRAETWWGAAVNDDAAGYDGNDRPDYSGLLLKSVKDKVQSLGAETTSAVIEFGTFSNQKMLQALLLDRWLRCEDFGSEPAKQAAHINQIRHRFCPNDPVWRESVIKEGYSILNQTMQGLSSWKKTDG